MEKVNLAEKFSLFTDVWSPKVVGELNGQRSGATDPGFLG